MNVERETLVEVGVSIASVVVFILLVGIVGTVFGNGGLHGQGALALVGVMVFFVVLMAAVGLALSRRGD